MSGGSGGELMNEEDRKRFREALPEWEKPLFDLYLKTRERRGKGSGSAKPQPQPI